MSICDNFGKSFNQRHEPSLADNPYKAQIHIMYKVVDQKSVKLLQFYCLAMRS